MINHTDAENEKEAEMQIGYPTDVKHVAHIGLDGQSVNCPSPVISDTFCVNNFHQSDRDTCSITCPGRETSSTQIRIGTFNSWGRG